MSAMQVSYSFGQNQLPEQIASTHDLLLKFYIPLKSDRRRPVNVALVIDISGSMGGAPLRHAIRAAQKVVDDLDEYDTVSVVLYDDTVFTLIEPTKVTDEQKKHLKDKLAKVRAGGLTNLSGGWLRGVELVKSAATSETIDRVLLLTDGIANVGITQDEVLIKTAAKMAEEGVPTTTLGFDDYFNEDVLLEMARASGGNFYYIQSIDDAEDVFSFELQTMKAVAAQNLKLSIKTEDQINIDDVLSIQRLHQSRELQNLELGDIYEDEDKLVGLRIKVPEFAAGEHQLLQVQYTLDIVKDGVIVHEQGEVAVKALFGPLTAEIQTDVQMTLDFARLRIAAVKEDAINLADKNEHATAQQKLNDLIDELNKAGLHEHFEIAEEIEQLRHYAARIGGQKLDDNSRKELIDQSFQGMSRSQNTMLGRGVTIDAAVMSMSVVQDATGHVELECVREGGKLRIKVVSDGYDHEKNVQFPRDLRAAGARYVVEGIEESANGSFYRTVGQIQRLVREGEEDPLADVHVGSSGRYGRRSSRRSTSGVTKAAKTSADLETTDSSEGGILVQCVKAGSKLRARVVQDGYEPDWNMRFPRGVREEGMLYVVDEVVTAPDGKSYIAKGEIRRLVQIVQSTT